ncbi:MAG TPA: prepilin-type N-terminal cleavage/methylation domain-containing protein [Galbitalea sp.]|jgi:type IV pilus assembly protein PilA
MLIRINEALAKRRAALKDDEGFTLIELLVVVIIIGILAAIAIPVYLGIQNNAKESATQTDVGNAKTAVIAFQTDQGALPTATQWTAGLDSKYGYTLSTNTDTITFTADITDASAPKFCIEGTSVTGTTFGATESLGVAKGTCAGAVFTPAG